MSVKKNINIIIARKVTTLTIWLDNESKVSYILIPFIGEIKLDALNMLIKVLVIVVTFMV